MRPPVPSSLITLGNDPIPERLSNLEFLRRRLDRGLLVVRVGVPEELRGRETAADGVSCRAFLPMPGNMPAGSSGGKRGRMVLKRVRAAYTFGSRP